MDIKSPLSPIQKAKPLPVTAAEPPPVAPEGASAGSSSSPASHTQTLKLRPLIRRSDSDEAKAAEPAAAESAAAPSVTEKMPAMQQLRGVTQKLKGITQQIPQQAILHKTGIIADSAMTEAQKQAAKSRTARISLSDAIGVSPVAEQPTPSRTIRIKRPESAVAPSAAPAEPAPEVPTAAAAPTEQKTASITQKKTLRLARPGAAVRPAGKFKKPVAAVTKPAAEAAPATDGEAAAEGSVEPAADAELAPVAAAVPSAPVKPDVPPVVAVLGLLLQLAACGVMGFVGWLLYQNTLYPAGWCF